MEHDLLRAVKRGRISHAYLIDDRGLAMQCAALLLCDALSGCGKCRGCELFAALAHPDYIELSGQSIKVDAVRGMLRDASLLPVVGRRKVVHIACCETMTPAAQNALLKTLEDPPEGVIFLLSGRQSGMLPTVVSRCALIRAEKEIELSGASEALSRAPLLFTSPHELAKYYLSLNGEQLVETLTLHARFLSGCAAYRAGAGSNPSLVKTYEACEGDAPGLAALVGEAVKRLRANANPRLTISAMLVKAENLRRGAKGCYTK